MDHLKEVVRTHSSFDKLLTTVPVTDGELLFVQVRRRFEGDVESKSGTRRGYPKCFTRVAVPAAGRRRPNLPLIPSLEAMQYGILSFIPSLLPFVPLALATVVDLKLLHSCATSPVCFSLLSPPASSPFLLRCHHVGHVGQEPLSSRLCPGLSPSFRFAFISYASLSLTLFRLCAPFCR